VALCFIEGQVSRWSALSSIPISLNVCVLTIGTIYENLNYFARIRSTIKAFEVLSRAQYHWKIDTALITGVRRWIFDQQHEDGHFEGHSSDTLDEILITTAETLAILLEIGLDDVRSSSDTTIFLRHHPQILSALWGHPNAY
jgi:prenyltransferase beta subunit